MIASDLTAPTGVSALTLTTIVGFATMLAQGFFASATARRNHAWDVEDREKKAELVRVKTEATARELDLQQRLDALKLRMVLEQREHTADEHQKTISAELGTVSGKVTEIHAVTVLAEAAEAAKGASHR